jgi:HEAT repeat protein
MRFLPLAFLTTFVTAAFVPSASAADQKAGFLGKTERKWSDELKPSNPADTRRSAAFALGKLGGQSLDSIPLLVQALKDSDATVRDAAAYALGEICASLGEKPNAINQWDRTGPALMAVLARDGDAYVRRSAAFALGNQGRNAAPAQEILLKALDDRDAIVRQQAARALGRIGDVEPAAVVRLCSTLADPDPLVRRDSALALNQIGRPAARPALRPLLDRFKVDKDAEVRHAALDALVNLVDSEDKNLIKDFLPALNGEDSEAKRSAALAIANIGGPEAARAIGTLCDILRDDDPVLKHLAAAALANLGSEAAPAVPELGRLLTDPDPLTRRNACLALGRIGPKSEPAVTGLIGLLKQDEPDDVRRYAAEALFDIGPAAVKAAPALKRLLKEDRNAKVRVKCVVALGNFNADQEDIRAALEETLTETETAENASLVRYNAALVLAEHLKERVSNNTINVLQEALFDKGLQIYTGSSAKVKGTGGEARSGQSNVTETDEGDGRELIALGLVNVGRRANRPEIIKGLEDAAQSKSDRVRDAAKQALKAVRGK